MTLVTAVAVSVLVRPFQAQAVKRELPNGSVAIARSTDSPGRFTLTLALNASAFIEEPGKAGVRHLLEHIVAKGPAKDLDKRLETAGCHLTAETDRDATVFAVYGPSQMLPLAMTAIAEVCAPLNTSKEEITRETEIIRQEQLLHEAFRPFLDQAWLQAYGVASPSGDLPFLALQTPESLSAAKVRMFAGSAAVMTVSGDIEPSVAVSRCEDVLRPLAKQPMPPIVRDPSPPGASKAPGSGDARAVPVGGLGEAQTLAALAVALKAADQDPGILVAYDPSAWPGVILAYVPAGGQTRLESALGKPDLAWLARARQLVAAWAVTFNRTAFLKTRASAKLPFQYGSFDLTTLPTQAAGLTNDEISRARSMWGQGSAYVVKGAR